MVFVGLWIFTSRLTHVYVTSSASELKEKRSCNSFHLALYARMVRMDIDEKEMIAHYHRKCFKRKLLKLSAKEIARHIYCLVCENCKGCTITHLSPMHHMCLYTGKFKQLEYFDAALQLENAYGKSEWGRFKYSC